MNRIMTDRDIWPMLCRAIPALANMPLVTGMTLDLNLEAGKIPLVSITYYVQDENTTGVLAGKTYRLQQHGKDVSVDDFWHDFCRAVPGLKELVVVKLSLWVTAHQLVTMDIECELPRPQDERLLTQTYELAEVQ